ncbi:outer membrane protein assembly factor BamE [Seminibacterium arietis]|uniref:Outer membrane protein assembly factor BamE n=1 Tax=Seminibacterium arietis TaxID=1173502 RepID=A0ABW3I875_9PAST
MQFKSVIVATVFALSLTACSTVNKIVYRIDVPQGNYLEAATLSQVKVGMNAQQVQYLLGTPVLIDPFNNNSWYYIFLQQKAYQEPEQHSAIITFDKHGIVTKIDLDKPLPDDIKPKINNVIIEKSTKHQKNFWQFWK